VTAHEIAERNTNHRPDTVATDTPPVCQRTIAARTVSAVSVEQRPSRERVGDQTCDHVAMRGVGGRLPQV